MFARLLADKSAEVVKIRMRPDSGSGTLTCEISDSPFEVPAPESPAAVEDDETADWDEPPMFRRRRWSLFTAFSAVFSTASHLESSGFSLGKDCHGSCSRLGVQVALD